MSANNNVTKKNMNKKIAEWVARRNQYGLNLSNNLSRNIANAKRRATINLQNQANNKRRTNWRKHWGSQTRTRERLPWKIADNGTPLYLGNSFYNGWKRSATLAKSRANNLAYKLQHPSSLQSRFHNLLAQLSLDDD
jgi:hypothetical protein